MLVCLEKYVKSYVGSGTSAERRLIAKGTTKSEVLKMNVSSSVICHRSAKTEINGFNFSVISRDTDRALKAAIMRSGQNRSIHEINNGQGETSESGEFKSFILLWR